MMPRDALSFQLNPTVIGQVMMLADVRQRARGGALPQEAPAIIVVAIGGGQQRPIIWF